MLFPLWAKASLAAAAILGAAGATWQVQEWRHTAKQADALLAQQKAFERRLVELTELAAAELADREAGRIEARDRETEIRTIYRDRPPQSPDCQPPADALRVLDQAVDSANQRTGQPVSAVPAASAEARAIPRP